MGTKIYNTFDVYGRKYSVTRYGNGRTYVSSIHPYDDSEYHWAMNHNDKDWTIYIGSPGVFVERIAADSIVDVAKRLAVHDTGIAPNICHS